MRSLADSLASVKGDSLHAYFRNYWKARSPKVLPNLVDTFIVSDTVREADSTGDEVAMRESIIGMETCQIALDSNRSVNAELMLNLEMAGNTIDSLASIPKPLPWKESLGAFGLGWVLGKAF